MLGRVGEVIAGAQGQSAAGAGRRYRRGDPVPGMAGRRQLHLPRRARLRASAARSATLEAGAGDRARHPARRATCRCSSAAARRCRSRRELRAFFDEPKTLIVTKANVKSRVHRRVYLDYIGVKRFDADGNPTGEFRIVGLFTSTAYIALDPRRSRICAARSTRVLTRAGFDPDSHSGKALVNVLETYPRDELFQIDEDTLYQFALSILQLEERPRVRVLARRDRFDRFVSVLVYVPRERYDSQVRGADRRVSRRGLRGPRQRVLSVLSATAPLTRVHFIIGRDGGATPDPDRATLEDAVAAIVRTWTDALRRGAAARYEPGRRARCSSATATRSRTAIATPIRREMAVADIRVIEALSPERPLGVDFYRARRGRQAVRRPEGLEPSAGRSRCRSACRCWRTWASGGRRADLTRSRRRPPASPAPGSTTWCWSAPTAAPADLDALKARAGSLLHRGDARRRRERRLQRAGAGGGPDVARRGADPHHLAVPAADPRAVFAGLHVGDAAQACGARGEIVELFHGRFDPRRARRDATRAASARPRSLPRSRTALANGRQPRRGPHRAALRQRGAGGDPHQLLPARQGRPAEAGDLASSSPAASSTACRSPRRSTRSSSIRRASKACTCASARWRAAASAGRTGRRTSAPKSSAW